MKHVCSALLFTLACAHALAAPPADFETRVELLRQRIGVPGLAIAIVEDGTTRMAQASSGPSATTSPL